MPLRIPYNQLPNLGALQSDDIIPGLRPAFDEGSMTVGDLANFVKPYKNYVALLSQTGSADPTANIFENTIGNIVWTHDSNGTYIGTLTDAFTLDYSFVLITPNANVIDTPLFSANFLDVDRIVVYTYDISTSTYTDGLLQNTPIEIRVYPAPL